MIHIHIQNFPFFAPPAPFPPPPLFCKLVPTVKLFASLNF